MEELLKRIHIDPKIMVGKPVIRGTRITVEHIMNELAVGHSISQVIGMYPHLKEEDIRAACAYAAALLAGERITPIAAE
ncbi:MAG TPA: DUF433 domain-containing protein [Rhizomicrobium sp.]|jgi:uncharacterized protein (DUF433 family)|nr:DUF433 domain-containing protein [Rhizomicrobium sp.]